MSRRRPTSKTEKGVLSRLALPLAPWVALATLAALWPRKPAKPQPGRSVQASARPESFDAAEPGRGRLAPAPTRIPPKGWKDVAWRVFREVNDDKLSSVAGGVTFYSLLAMFPGLGVFVSLYGLFADVGQAREQLIAMSAVLPGSVVQILGDQMTTLAERPSASLSLAFVVSLLLAVWSANAGMKALFDGLNIAYDEKEKRNFFTLTLTTYLFTFGALVFLTVVAGLLVALPLAFKFMGMEDLWGLWAPLRWLILLAIGAAAFSVVYRYAPCRERARWRWVTPGGVFAAGFWLVGSLGFSWYVNNVANYDATYGSLGAVIGFMMWIWFSVMVILIGGELNAEIEHQTARDSTTGAEEPLGQRGAAMADTVGLSFHLNLKKLFSRTQVDAGRQAEKVRRAEAQPNSSSRAERRAA